MTRENQRTISDWAVATFGDTGSNYSCAARAAKEMAELLMELANNDSSPKAGEEVADVIICLYRVAERLGVNIDAAVDAKMAINRARKWNLDGHGHGYHVKEEPKAGRLAPKRQREECGYGTGTGRYCNCASVADHQSRYT